MRAPIERFAILMTLCASCAHMPDGGDRFSATSEEVAEKARMASVKISHMYGHGTGFAVAPNLIVTAAHVVDDEPVGMTVVTELGDTCDVVQVAHFPDKDVALMWVTDCKLHPLPIYEEEVTPGQAVWAAGYPLSLPWTVTRGIVSGGLDGYEGMVQLDAAVNPGMSGGPVLDAMGRVVGMNAALFTKDGMFAGITYAVRGTTIVEIMRRFWAD